MAVRRRSSVIAVAITPGDGQTNNMKCLSFRCPYVPSSFLMKFSRTPPRVCGADRRRRRCPPALFDGDVYSIAARRPSARKAIAHSSNDPRKAIRLGKSFKQSIATSWSFCGYAQRREGGMIIVVRVSVLIESCQAYMPHYCGVYKKSGVGFRFSVACKSRRSI